MYFSILSFSLSSLRLWVNCRVPWWNNFCRCMKWFVNSKMKFTILDCRVSLVTPNKNSCSLTSIWTSACRASQLRTAVQKGVTIEQEKKKCWIVSTLGESQNEQVSSCLTLMLHSYLLHVIVRWTRLNWKDCSLVSRVVWYGRVYMSLLWEETGGNLCRRMAWYISLGFMSLIGIRDLSETLKNGWGTKSGLAWLTKSLFHLQGIAERSWRICRKVHQMTKASDNSWWDWKRGSVGLHKVVYTLYAGPQPVFPKDRLAFYVDVSIVPEGFILHFIFSLRYLWLIAGPDSQHLPKQRVLIGETFYQVDFAQNRILEILPDAKPLPI